MKLLYITNGITGSGGLERVLSIKASALAEDYGYEIVIATLNEENHQPFYQFSPKVQFKSFFAKGNPLTYVLKYRQAIQRLVKEVQPDVISVCDDGLKGFFIPRIIDKIVPVIYERHASVNIFTKEDLLSKFRKSFLHFFMKTTLSDFARFVVLTKGNLKEWGSCKNIVVMPNPLSFFSEDSATLNEKKVIAVGSQGYNKGTDLLLEIWSIIENKFLDWTLEIYGRPHSESIYERLAKEKGLTRVHFFPSASNIQEKYLNSSVLTLTSRSEGFGMVLIEAMSCGLPVVSFDCPHGPGDIISDHQDGFLIENGNTAQFAEKLGQLMNDTELRQNMGAAGRENVKRYLPEVIVKEWDGLFRELVSGKSLE